MLVIHEFEQRVAGTNVYGIFRPGRADGQEGLVLSVPHGLRDGDRRPGAHVGLAIAIALMDYISSMEHVSLRARRGISAVQHVVGPSFSTLIVSSSASPRKVLKLRHGFPTSAPLLSHAQIEQPHWSRDIVLLVTEGGYVGMEAWLESYYQVDFGSGL